MHSRYSFFQSVCLYVETFFYYNYLHSKSTFPLDLLPLFTIADARPFFGCNCYLQLDREMLYFFLKKTLKITFQIMCHTLIKWGHFFQNNKLHRIVTHYLRSNFFLKIIVEN
jgi:hypothetical protein